MTAYSIVTILILSNSSSHAEGHEAFYLTLVTRLYQTHSSVTGYTFQQLLLRIHVRSVRLLSTQAALEVRLKAPRYIAALGFLRYGASHFSLPPSGTNSSRLSRNASAFDRMTLNLDPCAVYFGSILPLLI